jgi:Protein of unknown function (DUF2384)
MVKKSKKSRRTKPVRDGGRAAPASTTESPAKLKARSKPKPKAGKRAGGRPIVDRRRRSPQRGLPGELNCSGGSGEGKAMGVAEAQGEYRTSRRDWIQETGVPRGSTVAVPAADPVGILGATPSGSTILKILTTVFPTQDAMIAWLKRPHPDLGGRTPLQVVKMGYAGAVEGMLEAALLGLPS